MVNLNSSQKISDNSTDMSRYRYSQNRTLESYHTERSEFLTPFQRELLLKKMQDDLRPEYRRRIEIMLLADLGYSQTRICTVLGCSQEMARYWIAKAQAGQAHNWNDRPIGRPKTVNDQYLERLKELVNHKPQEYGYSFRSWTAEWLSKHLAKEFGIEVSDRHINRMLKKLGLSSRRRSEEAEKVIDLSGSKESGITIRDLQSSSSSGSLRLFNIIKTNQ